MYVPPRISRVGALSGVVATLLALFIGCGDPKGGPKGSGDSSNITRTDPDTTLHGGDAGTGAKGSSDSVRDMPCRLLAGFPGTMDSITAGYRTWVHGEDGCVTRMIETLAGSFISSGNRKAIDALDSLSRIADGYWSEFLSDQCVRLLHEAPASYINHLITLGDSSAMRDQLIMGITTAGQDSAAPAKAIEAIRSAVKSKSPALDKKAKAFLEECLNRANPIVN